MRVRRFFQTIALVLVVGVLAPAAAVADIPRELLNQLGIRQFSSGAERDMAALQSDLAWIGLYHDRIDGRVNRSTREAISTFLQSIDKPARRTLSDTDRELLRERAAKTTEAAGFRTTRFDWTGTTARLPSNFLRRPKIHGKELTHVWLSGRGASGLGVEFVRYDIENEASTRTWLSALVNVQTEEDEELDVLNRDIFGDTVLLSFVRDDQIQHHIHQIRGREVRGIVLSFDASSEFTIQPILKEILQSTDLFAGAAVPKSQIRNRVLSGDYPGGRDLPDWYRGMVGSGSGSIVTFDGHILTNHHVVAGCGRLTVNGQDAVLLGSDIRLDLALVRSPAFTNRAPVKFRNDSAVLGEPIYVMGYPVFDVSQSINVTDGIVSSTVGLRGDRSHIQITAPVQPGNSGGPVLDQHGAQIAVVVSKVSSILQIRRNIENIAWVIRSRDALEFMRRFGISPIETSRFESRLDPIEDRVSDWRQLTVRIECHDE